MYIMNKSGEFLKSLFVPTDCLQGEEVPVHLTWNKNEKMIIKIYYPKSMKLKEIFNVEENDFDNSYNILTLDKFIINGYIGLVFQSEKEDNFSIDKTIKILIQDAAGKEIKIERNIHLFRPEICIYKIPDKICVEFENNSKKFKLDNRIIIRNKGEGTAIINLNMKDESELIKESPLDSEEFTKKFWSDLDKKFNKIKREFQDYSELLDDLIQVGKNPDIIYQNGGTKIKDLFERIEIALQNNEIFSEDFVKAIVGAYLKNINLVTEIENFNIYLSSIELGKIIIQDPVDVIKLSPVPKKLSSKIHITDIALNKYDPIDISNIEFKSNLEGELPIYSIFEWK